MRQFLIWCSVLFPFTLSAQFGSQTRLLSTGTFEKWETVEIGILLPEQERSFRMFMDDRTQGKNPYTSDFIRMQFICNGKKYLRPAFYMEEAKPDFANNVFVTEQSEWPWRVRFSPPEAGDYECVLLISENPETATPQSTGIRFHVNEGNRHGILQILPGKTRMTFSDGTPFFILGQNIAWCNEKLKGGPLPNLHPVYESGYYEWFHYMHNLAGNGGNYVRIVVAPWGTSIDDKELNVYQQDRAYVLDSVIRLAEERGLYVHFVIELTNFYFAGIPREQWHPIRLAYQKEGMVAAELFKDSAALAAYDNYLRYVHSRWAYSANVAVIEVVPEHINWEGFKTHREYFSDYVSHVCRFMEQVMHDSLHVVNTSVDIHELDICKNPDVKFIDIHSYDSRFWVNRRRYFIYHKQADQIHKPFLFGEIGIGNSSNGCDPDDWEYCSDISMHNTLWSTTFIGAMGAGLYWWQWNNDGHREANYKPLRWFIDSIASGMHDYTKAECWDGNGLEVFSCVTPSKSSAVGWVHNTSYWWGNTTVTCRDRNGKTMMMPKDDDEPAEPVAVAGNRFVIEGLHPGWTYSVYFYDTGFPNRKIGENVVKAGLLGRIRVSMPSNTDCAFHVSRYFVGYF